MEKLTMLYPNEMILDCASGFLAHTEEDGFIRFTRFTKRQEALNISRNQGTKNGSTAGMALRFYCPAGNVSLAYRSCPGSSRKKYHIDVTREGKMLLQQPGTEGDEDVLAFENPLPGRITVWLPCLAGILLKELHAPEGLRPIKQKERVMFFGDSITQGYDADSPSLCYANRLAEYLNAESVNQAIGGDVFYAGNLGQDLIPYAPDRIFVAYGVNDWARSACLAETAADYMSTLRALFPEVQITVLLPIRYLEADPDDTRNERGETLQDARNLLRALAEENRFRVIDGLPFLPQDPGLYADGTLHPNDRGFAFYFDGIKKALEEEQ